MAPFYNLLIEWPSRYNMQMSDVCFDKNERLVHKASTEMQWKEKLQ